MGLFRFGQPKACPGCLALEGQVAECLKQVRALRADLAEHEDAEVSRLRSAAARSRREVRQPEAAPVVAPELSPVPVPRPWGARARREARARRWQETQPFNLPATETTNGEG